MPQKKIWEKDGLYRFLRPYVDLSTRLSYRSFKLSGSLPADGAVFIAPNHTGTLMDALVVLASRRAGTAFGARADIFRKGRTARILHWLKIVPMVRARDGIREVQRNRDTMEVVDDILAHGMPFCMFPEGRHNPMHSLLPLQKGIARMAFASAEVRQTYIVPTGIEYDDFFHYRADCSIRYGEPIDVNAFLAEHAGLAEADRYKLLLDTLAEGEKLIPYLDIPLQHIDDDILSRMHRRGSGAYIRRLLDYLYKNYPDFTLRTTMMVGFPGETESQFQTLLAFLRDYPFDRVGAFAFSPEEGTKAATMPDQVPDKIKQARLAALMAQQKPISLERNRRWVGRQTELLIEELTRTHAVGRTPREAPDVDGRVKIPRRSYHAVGEYEPIVLTAAGEYDMKGESL